MALLAKRKENDVLLIDGYIKGIIEDHSEIPMDILNLFLLFYHETFQILKWSDALSATLCYKLSHDNTFVTRTLRGGIRYICVDTEPVKDGIHLWRLRVNTQGGWIRYGVGQKKPLSGGDASNSYRLAFGISKFDEQWYPKQNDRLYWADHSQCDKKHFKEIMIGDVDILLNLDENTLSICVVGLAENGYQAKIFKIPTKEEGWVPHFDTNSRNQTLQIAKIPIAWYGLHDDNIFPFSGHEEDGLD